MPDSSNPVSMIRPQLTTMVPLRPPTDGQVAYGEDVGCALSFETRGSPIELSNFRGFSLIR